MEKNASTSSPPITPEQVFYDHAEYVYNLASRLMGNDADAEDVTQDVLLQVVRKLHTFRGDADIKTWLHRITVNAALAQRKKRAKREELEIHDPLQHFSENGHPKNSATPWTLAPDKQALNNETNELIEKAIAGLPEPYRDVYVLSDVQQVPNAEIAEYLGLSVPAVKSRLHRSRMMMRDVLAPHFQEVAS